MFLLALLFLACSLNPREVLDGSLFRCCCERRTSDQEPQTYATLNEFIFESDDNHESGFVALNHMPTTMEQVFPDLLGGDVEEPNQQTFPRNNNNDPQNTTSKKNNNHNNQNHNAGLSEPLL